MTEQELRQEQLENLELFVEEVAEFIKSIPEEVSYLRSYAAERIILEAVIWAAHNHYQGLGILQEALLNYRDSSKDTLEEECACQSCVEDTTTEE